jgi:hypothetical protein
MSGRFDQPSSSAGATPRLQPPVVDLKDESVAARLERDEQEGAWLVTVLVLRHLGRDAGAEPVRGEDVSARLVDEAGVELEPEERPSGPLREAGGTLGVSANAPFRFRGGRGRPAALVVEYVGTRCRFVVSWPDGAEDAG